MFISLIVPVYNVERYLEACLQSITKQTYTNFEVILVNDGSSDTSPQICEKWIRKDNRFSVIHKRNEGLMSAWIDGLSQCNGDYIVFIDSDDWIDQKFLEMFVRVWEQYINIDIIIGNYSKDCYDKKETVEQYFTSGYYEKEEIVSMIYPQLLNNGNFQGRGINPARWGKLIKKDLILNNLKFCDKNISYGEDLNIIFPVLLDCESLYLMNDKENLYHYRVNPTSILQSYNPLMLHQIFLLYTQLYLICKKKQRIEFETQIQADYLASIVQYYKNELISKKSCVEIAESLKMLKTKIEVTQIAQVVDWSKYSLVNKSIIMTILSKSIVFKVVSTQILRCLKKLQERIKKMI